VSERTTVAERRAMREAVRTHAEPRPGIYRFLGREGEVLYVGTSRRLRARLLSYFTARRRRRAKAPLILRHAVRVEWDYTPDPFSALLAELRAIKRFRPRFNVAHVSDEWPRGYLALTGGPVPGLRIVRSTDDPHATRLWGPFRNVAALRDAMRTLADVTGLRDCTIESQPMQWRTSVRDGTHERRAPFAFADTRGATRSRVAGCLRHAVGSCAGMCIGEGDGAAYSRGVARALAFLDRRPSPLLRELHAAMQQAGDALAFERAASLRDKHARLHWLRTRLTRFQADADRLTFLYAPPGDSPRIYCIRRGTVRADVPLPRTPDEQQALDALVARIYLAPDPSGGDIPLHDLEEFALVASWFRRYPESLAQHTRPAPSSAS
jgi:excinuclease UvrABC nuclease subunit